MSDTRSEPPAGPTAAVTTPSVVVGPPAPPDHEAIRDVRELLEARLRAVHQDEADTVASSSAQLLETAVEALGSAERQVRGHEQVVGLLLDRLPRALVDLARLSTAPLTVQELLTGVVRACATALQPDVHLSVSLGSPLEPVATSASSPTAQLFDGSQLMAAQGPGISALDDGATVLTDDVSVDPRWPRLSRHVPADVRAAAAVPLEVGSRSIGVLSVYGPTTWDDRAVRSVELLGEAVAVALHERTVHAELEGLAADMSRALTSRAVIEQAKGMIMAMHGVDADEAFARLAAESSRAGVKVRELARRMVERTHALDDTTG